MRIDHIELRNFKSYAYQRLELHPELNLLLGVNGSGKTNFVDAIHYLCMSRSFTQAQDRYLIHFGHDEFHLDGQFSGQIRGSFELSAKYSKQSGKQFFVNQSPLEKISDLIGRVPVVVLTPDDRRLTKEGPAERRSFLDAMISQTSNSYLANLIDFRRVLKQRNRLLADDRKIHQQKRDLLAGWDVQFARLAARIVEKRREVLSSFREQLRQAYAYVSETDLHPDFTYKCCVDLEMDSDVELEALLSQQIEAKIESDIERGITSFGPHREELLFTLGDLELRRFGSQGQHRLFSIALKLAELHYFSETHDERPILILDDVFGELDEKRTRLILETVKKNQAQTFVTAANAEVVRPLMDLESTQLKRFETKHGQLICVD